MNNTSNFEGFGVTATTSFKGQKVTTFDEVFDFDTPIVAKEFKPFTLFEEGDYNFTVIGIDKEDYDGSKKIPPCKRAVLSLEVKDELGNSTTLKYNMFYCATMMRFIDNMFIGTGLAKENEQYIPNPDRLMGATGMCKVVKRPNYNDETKFHNEVGTVYRNGAPF